jgi:trans-aconitate 2-methyltransferase
LTEGRTPKPRGRATSEREWDARSYHKVSEPQFEWGKRVLSTLALGGDEILMDAGCGTGRLTGLVAERLPDGRVVAVDRSENMTRVAAETLAPFQARSSVALADLSALPFRAAFDVVFSTATFHWILDHQRLFDELYSVLKAGGRLHAQCGGGKNLERIHRRAHALMQASEFKPFFGDWREPWEFASVTVTQIRLERAGFTDLDVSLDRAPVVFPDGAAYAAFVSTVVLRPFLVRIENERLRQAFVDRMTTAAEEDDPAYELDYWRLNIRARR